MLRGNRFRLVTLGRLTLLGGAGDEDASLARRRAKLALLAILAMARRPVARDALLELFWGDQDEARARHSLSNALSSLRRTLGPRSITTRDTEVALVPDAPLDVDALDLADAVEAQDYTRALELYAGPFMAGVYVQDSPSFEQWVSRERRRLEALFVQACTRQCAALARSRRWPDCAAVALRWLEVEPLSSDAALFLLNARKAPGSRAALAAALDEYEHLRARIARDFDVAPDRVVVELASRIREQLAAAEQTPPTQAVPDDPPLASAEPASTPQPSNPAAPPTRLTRGRPQLLVRRPLVWAAALLLVGIAGIAGVLRFGAPSDTSPGPVGKPVIAVLAMELRTDDSAMAWLADGLPPMIAGRLARSGDLEIVSPARVRAVIDRSGYDRRTPPGDAVRRDLARRLGATLVASGSIGHQGTDIVLDLTVHDVESGALVRNDVLTRGDALALADEAAARILGAANVGAPGPRLSELETSSLEAYQRYLRALELGHAGRLTDYVRELDATIELDSGFIAAVRARMSAALSMNDTARVRQLRETMRRHSARATEFDRMEQAVYDAFYAGERERSDALARALVRRYPRDPRAYQLLQMILGSHGAFEEAEQVAEQGIALDSLAIDAGSGPCAQCVGFSTIVNLHWVRRDFPGAAEWARRWIRAQPDGASAWAALAWTYSYMQRPDSALPLMQRAVSLSGGDTWGQTEYARMLLVARRYDAADSAIAGMEASPSAERREAAGDLRALLERERGRLRASNRVLDSLMRVAPASRGFLGMMHAGNLRLLGDFARAARRYEEPAHAPGESSVSFPLPAGAARAFCWHHALAADAAAPLGDTNALRHYADTLERACGSSYYGRDWRLYRHVRGLLAMQAGRYEEAERELAQAVWTSVEGWTRTTVELANAQAALGRPADAVATLRSGYATRLDAMGRYVPISELDYRMSRAFAAAGATDSARVYAAYARRAWRDADPEVKRLLMDLP
jgi:DNA-binding SARP family transcriptional activator/TolB-like protein/predicted Zn-dependent protease